MTGVIGIFQRAKFICNSHWVCLTRCLQQLCVWLGHLLHILPPHCALLLPMQWQLLLLRVSWRISGCSTWWQFCHPLQEEQIWASKLHLFIHSMQCHFAWQTFGASVVPCGFSPCVTGQGSSCACEYLPEVIHCTSLALEMGCDIIARRQDFPGGNGEACAVLERVGCYAIHFTWFCAVKNYFFLLDLQSGHDSQAVVHNI